MAFPKRTILNVFIHDIVFFIIVLLEKNNILETIEKYFENQIDLCQNSGNRNITLSELLTIGYSIHSYLQLFWPEDVTFKNFQVPDVMEYVRIKGKVYELQKNIKIWSRRSHLQDVKFNFCYSSTTHSFNEIIRIRSLVV